MPGVSLALAGSRCPDSEPPPPPLPPPSSASAGPPKARRRFDIESLLAEPEPPRRSPRGPSAWAALAAAAASPASGRFGVAAGLLPFPAVFLLEPPPPLPPPEGGAGGVALFSVPLGSCAQPGCPRPGLDGSHCAVAGSSTPQLSWRPGVPCKIKRVRTVFTPEQLERLEKEFLKQQYMVGTERVDLAATLRLSETQVKVWFQNRRIKWRKQSLEQKAAKLSQLATPQRKPSQPSTGQDNEEEEAARGEVQV